MLFKFENYGREADVIPNHLLLELARVLLESAGVKEQDINPTDVVMVAVQMAKNPEITGILPDDIRSLGHEIWLQDEASMEVRRRDDGLIFLSLGFTAGSVKTGACAKAPTEKTIASITKSKQKE